MERSNLTYSYYTPGDELSLVQFHQKLFGGHFDLDFWKWKYIRGIEDSCRFICIARDPEGSIVGHLAAVVFHGNGDGNFTLFARLTEFAIAPDFRGTGFGVATKLYRLLCGQLLKYGVKLVYSLPNRSGFLVAKRQHKHSQGATYNTWIAVPWALKRFLGLKCQYNKHHKFHRKSGIRPLKLQPIKVKRFEPEEVDSIWGLYSRNIEYSISRDAVFLNWRYGSYEPERFERILWLHNEKAAGVSVVEHSRRRRLGSVAYLMECFATSTEFLKIIVDRLAFRYTAFGNRLIAVAVNGSQLEHTLEKAMWVSRAELSSNLAAHPLLSAFPGFLKRIGSMKEEPYFSTVHLLESPEQSADIARKKWHFSLGEIRSF